MKKNINYQNLVVNPENYRFDPVDTQEQALDLMLEKKGVEIFNLAKHILENGLDLTKDFRVLKITKGKYLILDGNRRTTAIKCLHNTSIIKDVALKAKFSKLKIDINKLPKEIQSFVYSSEKDASKWIKLDHGGKNKGVGQDSWGSPEIQRFGYKFEGKISPAMQVVNIIEEETGKKINTDKLKISTVDRIFSNPESRSYLGINMKNQKILIVGKKEDSVKRLDKLFDTIVEDDIKVDKVYTKDKSIAFMKDLFGDKPKRQNDKPNSTDTNKDVAEESNIINSEQSDDSIYEGKEDDTIYGNDTIKYKENLIDKKRVPKVESKKIKEVYKELTIISVKTCPTAVFALVRILTDITVKEFLTQKGYKFNENGHLIIESQENNKQSLKEKMNYVANSYIDGDLKNSIIALNEDFLTKKLNEVMHNSIFSATETSIRDFWKNLNPFLEFLWKEIIIIESQKK